MVHYLALKLQHCTYVPPARHCMTTIMTDDLTCLQAANKAVHRQLQQKIKTRLDHKVDPGELSILPLLS